MSAKESVKIAHYHTVRAPIVTEKSTVASELGKYVFKVAPDATKVSIKEAVEALFKVKVTKVNIINHKGKTKRFRKTVGRRSDVKKAIVTLAEGSSIEMTGA